MNRSETIWWTKLAVSIVVAGFTIVAQIYFSLSGVSSFMLGIVIYLGLSDLLSRTMGIDRYQGLKVGVGAYFFTWLTAWVLIYTYARFYGLAP
jgi:hypothetical protein